MSKPFYWEAKKGWYVYFNNAKGQRRKKFVGKTQREAYTQWKIELRNSESIAIGDATFSAVAAKWLSEQLRRLDRAEVSQEWVARVTRTIESFSKANPRIRCRGITASVAREWLGPVSVAYERTEIGTLKQILRWAADEKLIPSSPLASVVLPKGERRDIVLSLDDHQRLVDAVRDRGFKQLLWLAWWTGCRPSELRALKWEYMREDLKYAELKKHKTAKQTGRRRRIYFCSDAREMLTHMRKRTGYVFMNSRGKIWTKDAIVSRINRLQEKTGINVTAYAYRHSYATRALEQGISVADVAEILGTSIEVIHRNYAHLDKNRNRLSTIADAVI